MCFYRVDVDVTQISGHQNPKTNGKHQTNTSNYPKPKRLTAT